MYTRATVAPAVYAVNAVAHHYGPSLNAEGLKGMRELLSSFLKWRCDVTWIVEVLEDGYMGEGPSPYSGHPEPNPDFCPAVISEEKTGLNFAEVVRRSRTGLDV